MGSGKLRVNRVCVDVPILIYCTVPSESMLLNFRLSSKLFSMLGCSIERYDKNILDHSVRRNRYHSARNERVVGFAESMAEDVLTCT